MSLNAADRGFKFDKMVSVVGSFPGSFGLYRNGVLIGAIGVSGDGVVRMTWVAPPARTISSRRTQSGPINSFIAALVCPTQNSRVIPARESRLTRLATLYISLIMAGAFAQDRRLHFKP